VRCTMRTCIRVVVAALAVTVATATTVSSASADTALEFANEHSTWCLAVSGGHGDGPIIQWGCTGSDDQYWYWDSTGSVVDGGKLYLRLRNKQNKCIFAVLTSLNGAQLYAKDCNQSGGGDQYAELWDPELVGKDSHNLNMFQYHNYATRKCIADEGSSISWGGAIVGWDCLTHDDQYWYPRPS